MNYTNESIHYARGLLQLNTHFKNDLLKLPRQVITKKKTKKQKETKNSSSVLSRNYPKM